MCPSPQLKMASPTNSNDSSTSSNHGHRKIVSEHRRCNKPIMEKKRRARINSCLDELKNLILDAMKKDPARHSKLEKADILEMTVKHLESLQRQQMAMVVAADPGVLNKYRAGFNECTTEVGRFLGRGDAPPLDPHLKRRLLAHLSNCLNNVDTTEASSPLPPADEEAARMIRVQLPATPAGHVMQLVPTCLPSGDIAFVLPQSSIRREVAASAAVAMVTTVAAAAAESAESRAARTAVVAPLSVALDLSITSLEAPDKSKPMVTAESLSPPASSSSSAASGASGDDGVDTDDEGDVWRPW